MITFTGVSKPDGTQFDFTVPADETKTIDAHGLTLLPGLIDPHVHFRTPGMEHKENWVSASKAAIRGGYTTVFDMPNTLPPTITAETLAAKKKLIDAQLKESGIPLRYQLFFGADKNHLDEIHKVRSGVAGIKVFMGCSTGNLVIDDDESLHAVFEAAAASGLLVAVHAEDEAMICERKVKFAAERSYETHSKIRSPDVAVRAVEKAIALSRQYQVPLYILHVSTEDEIDLIRAAKHENLPVYAETTPHHLFLNDTFYSALQGKALVNPPLRSPHHSEALFAAIREGIIDTVGSDHAPHTPYEKQQPYGSCPSGMPGIETTLPLLLTACRDGLLSMDNVSALTCHRARMIFHVPENMDAVLVDLNRMRSVDESKLATRCGWSPFADRELTGWPEYVVLRDRVFHVGPGK